MVDSTKKMSRINFACIKSENKPHNIVKMFGFTSVFIHFFLWLSFHIRVMLTVTKVFIKQNQRAGKI